MYNNNLGTVGTIARTCIRIISVLWALQPGLICINSVFWIFSLCFTELQKKLGDSRLDQKRKLDERLARRKQLVLEREANGLSTDETIIDAIQDQETADNGDDDSNTGVSDVDIKHEEIIFVKRHLHCPSDD